MKFPFRKVVKLDVTKWSLEYQLSTISTKSEEPFQTEKKTLAYLIIDTWEDISFIWSIILTWSTFSHFHFFFIYIFCMSLLTLLWWSHIIPWIVRPQYCYRYWINFLWWMIPTRKIIFHFEHLNKIYGKAFLECSYIYNLNTLKYSPITVTVSLCVWKDYVTG